MPNPHVFALLLAGLALCGCTATAVDRDASYPRLMKLAGDIERRGDAGTATTLYLRAAQAPEATAEVWNRLGRIHLQGGDAQAAEQAFQQALALDPEDAESLLGLGTAQLRLGYPQRARPLLHAAAATLQTAEAYNRLGVAESQLGHTTAACGAFARAHRLAPTDLDSRSNLALAYALDGKLELALAEAEGLDQTANAQARHRRNVLLVQVLAGNLEAAQRVRLDRSDAAARQMLIDEALRITAITDPVARTRALGLSDGN